MVTFSDIGQRRADPSFQLNPQRSLLDPSMIGGGQNRIFKLHLIYPQKKEVERPGTIYKAPAGTGRGNYAHTGDWELNEQERKLLESRLRRSLEESGVKVQPGMETYHSKKGVDEFRTNWGPPTAELGIGNYEYPDEIVPVYLIRGLGAHAGGQPGEGFKNSYFTIGDGVIESLAGREGINGKTAYEIIKNAEEPWNAEFHKFNSSYQAQMGTVLHEGFHAVAALPHNEEEMLHDYSSNYAGAHGEEFGKAIDDSVRGRAGTDRFAAMNLIMNEPWNYGWGQQAQGLPGQMPTTGGDVQGTVPRPGGVDEVTQASIPSTGPSGSGKYFQSQPGVPLGEIASTMAGAAQDIPRGTEMPQVDDFRLRNGVWEGYNSNNQWNALPNSMQEYLNSNFSGVSGTGSNQLFLPFDDPDTLSSPVRRDNVISALRGISQPAGSTGAGSSPRSIQSLWGEFMPGVPWPPVDKLLGEIDTNLINSFLSSLRANNVAGWSDPKRFTIEDANGKTHVFGQAPGSTKVIDLGIVGEDPQASAVFETGPDGRTYIRQPDGELELVPEPKVTTPRTPGAIEYDPVTGRNIIRQPDGSIQFAPEPRQQANIQTDSSGRRYITQPDGSIQYLGREFEPGVVSQGGYNLLQQPTGALSQLAPLPEPAGVETIGGMQFIRTSTGELMPLDNVMNRMMENMVVTGDLEGAAAIHAWQTRPSNQEYFDRALAYMRSPADQLVISAIARGQGLVSPPPEETIQRIGPQPDYLTEAFNMLQDQMQMGLPEGTKTFADTLAERAAAAEVEALELANETTRINNNNTQVAGQDAHDAAVIANQTAVVTATDNHTSEVLNQEAADINNSIAASALTGDDDDEPVDSTVIDSGGRPGGMSQLQWEYQQAVDAYNDAMGWTGRTPGNPLSPADQLIGDAARGGATIANQIAILQQNTPAPEGPEEQDISEQMPVTGTGTQGPVPLPGPLSAADAAAAAQVTTPTPQVYLSEEEEEQVAPLTFEEAIASIGREGMTYTEPDEPDEEPVTFSQLADAPPEMGVGVDPFESPVEMLTTEEALAEIGADPGLSYAGVGASVPDDPDDYAGPSWITEEDWFAGGGRYDDNTAIVGESGPELAIFPRGTEIVPLDRKMKPDQARRLRRRGIRGMQEGGIVFDSPLPLGIRQLQAGRSLGAPRGQLLRTAGIALPSAQARRRMLPSEREAFGELGRLAGIPEAEFQQELGITTPSGTPRAGSARMLPLSLRR